jgi:hypothetical protein
VVFSIGMNDITYREKNCQWNKSMYKNWHDIYPEPDMLQVLKLMVSLFQTIIVCTYTVYQYFFPRDKCRSTSKFYLFSLKSQET